MTFALLLFFILIRQITYVSTITITINIASRPEIWIAGFYLIQFFTAPFQAGYSDHYCRKRSLVFGFIAIFLAHAFLFLAMKFGWVFLLISLLINGALGNTYPITVAAILDIKFIKNIRVSLGLVTIVVALGWVIYSVSLQFISLYNMFLILTSVALICSWLAWQFFQDRRDEDLIKEKTFSIISEFGMIKELLKRKWFFYIIKGYLITDFVFYIYCYYPLSRLGLHAQLVFIYTVAGGYILGSVIQFVFKFSEYRGFQIGLFLTLFSNVSFIIIDYFFKEMFSSPLFYIFNTVFAVGYGIFDPCLYTYVSKGQKSHKQGKIFGVIDSIDNSGELLTGLILVVWTTLNLKVIQYFNVLIILLGIFYVFSSYKLRKKIKRSKSN